MRAKQWTVSCVVRDIGSLASSARLRGTIRLAGQSRRVTRSGRGTVQLKIRSTRPVTRSQRVVVLVRKGTASRRMTVKVGRTLRGAMGPAR